MACNMLNNVSIRLMSGGHTFSIKDIDAIKQAGAGAVVEFVTPKTVLRPEQGFDRANAADDLAATGYVVADNEVVVSTKAQNGKVAVMAVSAACVEAIEALGVEFVYTSPLLAGDDLTEGSYIALYGDVLYVRVYKDGMRFAEAIAVENDADVLYYLTTIDQVYGIYNTYARAEGDVERLNRVCRKYFKVKF